mmetsp:Transcript_66713/g.139264  ORF Transcript_66713/g.139264 Transcript_66713/m.139264 type:complete len:322 (-) Transcript_66713:69-1034(-)
MLYLIFPLGGCGAQILSRKGCDFCPLHCHRLSGHPTAMNGLDFDCCPFLLGPEFGIAILSAIFEILASVTALIFSICPLPRQVFSHHATSLYSLDLYGDSFLIPLWPMYRRCSAVLMGGDRGCVCWIMPTFGHVLPDHPASLDGLKLHCDSFLIPILDFIFGCCGVCLAGRQLLPSAAVAAAGCQFCPLFRHVFPDHAASLHCLELDGNLFLVPFIVWTRSAFLHGLPGHCMFLPSSLGAWSRCPGCPVLGDVLSDHSTPLHGLQLDCYSFLIPFVALPTGVLRRRLLGSLRGLWSTWSGVAGCPFLSHILSDHAASLHSL